MEYNRFQRLYENGLPFDGPLDLNLQSLKKRVYLGKASLMIIDGLQGEGKTTLAVHCADHYQGKEIDLKLQYAMGGVQFMQKLEACRRRGASVLIYDEAGDFSRKGARTKFNFHLTRVFETFRAFKIFIILVLPNFNILDRSLFDAGVPRLLVNCYDRNENYGNYRAYDPDGIGWLRKIMDEKLLYHKSKAYNLQEPVFRGHFYDLYPERARLLDFLTVQGKSEILVHQSFAERGLLTFDDLALKLGRSVAWVRGVVARLKIRPEEVYKKRKYFSQAVLARLEALKKG